MPYDPIGLKESTPLSVSRSISAYDYLRISESFFRVDRSLVFPDLISLKDGSILTKGDAVLSSDALIYDSVSYKGATQVNALDVFSDDSISYTKTYSPILFTMLAYRVRPRYLTLSVSDVISTTDYVSYTKTYSPILFTMLAYRVKPRYLTLSVSDYDIASDYLSIIKMKTISVLDSVLYDSTSYTNTYSPVFFTMLAYRVKPRYLMLSVSDYPVINDNGSYVKVKVVSVYDYNIGYDYRPLVINRSIIVNDYKVIYDEIVAAKPNTLSVYDKMGYDYVPNQNPSNVHFMSIYPNPSVFGILVSDYGVLYDSASAVRPYKPVVISDIIGVNDGVSMKNMTVMVYDKLIADNAALNNV